jgi:hypothetical protein
MQVKAQSRIVVFLVVFVISFFVQSAAWVQHNDIVDSWIWSNAIERASGDFLYQPEVGQAIVNSAYGYPGSTIILPSAVLVKYGVSPMRAMQSVLSFEIALGVAMIAWMCHRLRPQSFWWIGATLLLLFCDLYYIATPPSSVITVWIPFILLCVMYLTDHADEENRSVVMFLGIASGFAVATRFDISLMICASVLLFLIFYFKKLPWLYIATCSISLLCFDPYLITDPVRHLAIFIYKSTQIQAPSNAASDGLAISLMHSRVIFQAAPPAILAFAGALVSVFQERLRPFSRTLLLWLIATSSVIFIALFSLQFHAQWYFFPIYMFWEVMLPLFIWTFFTAIDNISSHLRNFYVAALYGGVLIAQLYLFINILRV